MVLKRRKRAAAEDLYRQCQLGGDCPPDIKNKIEHNTIADLILKWGSLGVFLGGLGIGTGRGTGGRFGYRPLPEPAAPGGRPGATLVRPTIPVDTVTPDITPVDALDASSPSIVPLTDAGTDSSIVEVIAEAQPNGGPNAGSTEPPSIEVTPEPPPKKIRVTKSQHPNPVYDFSYDGTETSHTGQSFVHMGSSAQYIGGEVTGEEIELSTWSRPGEATGDSFSFNTVETGFGTSTPAQATVSAPRLYGRRIDQVRVSDTAFLTRPDTLIVFDNPTFNPEVTQVFEQDLEELAAAPDPNFQDVNRLSRPYYSQTNEGRIRVSRVGSRGTLTTRSGIRIGPTVHFFQDLSSIAPGDTVIQESLGEVSGSHTIYHGHSSEEFEMIDLAPESEIYSEDDLLDHIEEVGDNLQLVIGGGRRQPPQSVPTFKTGLQGAGGIDVIYPNYPKIPGEFEPPAVPINPSGDTPEIIVTFLDSSYTVADPSLFRLRKRRKRRFH
ncbi:L2 protein [Pudu puda papillomavirus 1]|uniref:Minor capsid protein L2 n=1 Tax=Pudu puda papillomavirus 1 TaxID=1747360 RepID=A0A1I9KI00_9PAPI|nr:L2 protein [Pudu puda papillomavirus 1]ALP46955.1 L2 protein [Pudu puda papillomavirus 1]